MAVQFHHRVHQSQLLALCSRQPLAYRPSLSSHYTALLQRSNYARHIRTTAPLFNKRRRILPLRHLPEAAPDPPPYPYENGQKLFKQHLTGLYGGSIIKFGNIVSKQNKIKTRRTWYPNVQHKRLYSLALGKFIRVKLTTRVLRTIEKAGGIDEYLLGHKAQRVKELGEEGWRLRWLVLQTLRAQGSERVTKDPLLRKEVEFGDKIAELNSVEATMDGGEPVEIVDEVAEDDQTDIETEIEDRIQQRLDEDRLMREEDGPPPPRTLMQRVGSMFRRRR